MTGRQFYSTLGKIRITNRTYFVERGKDITKYKERILTEPESLEGIYVGEFKKKLIRSYKRSEPKPITFTGRHNHDLTEVNTIMPDMFDEFKSKMRPSKNPRRLDNPRMLSSVAMIKYGRKLIGVPMTNIYKCNYGKLLNVI
jgi:hypothetical protein